ncbi:MAG: 50S ribosomal protein L3 [candidate division KSB1 bacterium]
MSGLIGKKLGMTRTFDERGNSIPVTVIEIGPCYVTEIRTAGKHGYDAIQLGFIDKLQKQVNKPEAGHFAKAGVKPQRYVREFRSFKNIGELKLGDVLKADIFKAGDKVKVIGVSKGKGFQGVMKRHNFGGGSTTHGQSDRMRAPGSVGGSSYPSRVWKGMRMAGQMGNACVSMRNLKIVKVDAENNIVMVGGGVPGARNGILILSK